MMKNGKFFLAFGLGLVAGYVYHLKQIIFFQQQLIAAKKTPLQGTQADWWESNKPDTEDEYELTLAKRDWLRNLLLKYVHPYIDPNISSLLVLEVLMPLNDRLIDLEMNQSQENIIFEHMMRKNSDSAD